MSQNTLVQAQRLQDFVQALFVHAGMSESAAHDVARALIWADLRGIDTHGVSRVAFYLNFMQKGVIKVQPQQRVLHDAPAVQVFDADASAGAVAMFQAVEQAALKARAAGVGLVMVRATTHTGALGCFTQALARQGMVGIGLAASIPLMAYHGAKAAGVSTAPLSIAVPGPDDEPIILDMASGAMSMGQLRAAKQSGSPLPAGLALNAQGEPTTDPQQASIVQPMAGPKGSGLALMFELICSLVVGHPIIADFFSDKPGARKHRQNAWLLAIDIGRFGDLEHYRQEVVRTVAALAGLPPSVPGEPVRLPGDRGRISHAQRLREGIPLPAALVQELSACDRPAGLSLPW
jgi:LDH2 family malate/lactate/ureidoglycolate dehydrogenase